MAILLFFLDFFAVLSIFYFITGATFTKNSIRLLCSVLLFVGHLISIVLATPPYPNTFIIAPIIFLLFKESSLYKICWLTTYTLSEAIIVYILSDIYYVLTKAYENNTTPHVLLSTFDCIIFLIFIICSFCLRKKREKHSQILHNIEKRNYFLIIIFDMFAFVLLNISELMFFGTLNTLGQYVITFLLLFLIIALIVTVIAFVSTQYRNSLLKEKDIMNQRFLDIERKHYMELEQKNNDLRAFRHDFNSHILTLNNLLQEKDFERATQYLQNLTVIQTQNYYISTGNITADATINHFYDVLNKDILFKVSGYFLEDCFVDDFDLCTVISNLLKNASEAVEKALPDEDKVIYLNIDACQNRILILLKNTTPKYDTKELASLQTTKTDKKNHGFGLSNIQKITEKYHGFMQISFQEQLFITQVVLNRSL